MSALKKLLVPCAKIAVTVAVISYGAAYGVNKYAASRRQDVSLPGTPAGAKPGRKAIAAEKAAAEKAVTQKEAKQNAARRHYLAGVRYLQDNKFLKARAEFTIAGELDPDSGDIQDALRRAHKSLGTQPAKK